MEVADSLARGGSAQFMQSFLMSEEPEPPFDPKITVVSERLAGKMSDRGRATDKTAYRIRNTAALLIEATSVTDIRFLKQSDMAVFCNVKGVAAELTI